MISEKKFLEVYNKHKEAKFFKFILDKFLIADGYNPYKISIISWFIIFNIITITLLKNNLKSYALITGIIANGVFVLFGLLLLISAFANMRSGKKICDELNINLDELNNYCVLYKTK